MPPRHITIITIASPRPVLDITIVIPVYNRAACLDTVLRAMPACYPLIVVDNASTDASADVARSICDERNATPGAARAVVVSETQQGAAAARNCGLRHCTTEWIYFFDSDDTFTSIPVPDAATAATLDMVCFPVRMAVDGRERVRDYRPTADAATHILSSMLGTHSMLFRTDWLRAIGGWDNRCRVWDDWELGIRALMRRPRLLWIDGGAYHHVNVHDDSLTGPSYSARWLHISEAIAVVRDEVEASGDERLRRALDLRLYIVVGTLQREGNAAAAAALRATLRPSAVGRLLAAYTARGCRGAWRLALGWLNLRH